MTARGRNALVVVIITGALLATCNWATAALSSALLWAWFLLLQQSCAVLRVRTVSPDEPGAQALPPGAGEVQLLEAEGPLVFVSVPKIDTLLRDRPPWPSYLVLDLRRVSYVDGSALRALAHLIDCLEVRGGRFTLVCAPRSDVFTQLQRGGLSQRALGGDCCFTYEQAHARIAAYHAPACSPPDTRADRRVGGALRLVRLPAASQPS